MIVCTVTLALIAGTESREGDSQGQRTQADLDSVEKCLSRTLQPGQEGAFAFCSALTILKAGAVPCLKPGTVICPEFHTLSN